MHCTYISGNWKYVHVKTINQTQLVFILYSKVGLPNHLIANITVYVYEYYCIRTYMNITVYIYIHIYSSNLQFKIVI